ncbi:MAG: protein kinase [Vicinamibacterales bacterium]
MIDLTRWPDADAMIDEALARPAGERLAFVRQAAGDDAALREALEAVLAEADADDAFLPPGGALTGTIAQALARAEAEGAPAPAPRLAEGESFGPYVVTGVLGAGGMGEVYRARDGRLGRHVALKVLPVRFAADPARHDRLAQEARLLASLSHPSIGTIFGFEEYDGMAALVLELVEGPTLAERLRRGRLDLDEAIDLAIPIARALEAAHARGVVHRDLKPANIKVTARGDASDVKVLDFGIATALADGDRPRSSPGDPRPPVVSTDAASPGAVLGTAAYLSPERIRGRFADHRADIWAFGCVLFEMLTGTRAFDAPTMPEVVARVLEREPEYSRLPVGTPASLVRLLRRTLRKDPARRLGFIGDAVLDLEDARAELRGEAEQEPVSRGVKRRTARLVAVALIAGLAGGGLAVWRLMAPDPPRVSHLAVPIPEIDDLVSGELPGLAVSPDGRTIVYRTRRDGVIQLVRASLDQHDPAVLPGSANGASPFFSPDGQWVAFTGDLKLLKVPVTGDGPPIEVADAPGGARGTWTDAGEMLFSMGTRRVLFRVPAAGGQAQPLTALDEDAGDLAHEGPVALPGGRAALFTLMRPDGPHVAVVRLDSGEVRALTSGRDPAWLDDGLVVFARGDELWAARFDAGALALEGGAAPVLQGLEQGALAGTPHFAVSPRGTLVYMPSRPALDRRSVVWVARDGTETPLAVEPQAFTRASVSPDGTRVALAVASPENRDIWVFDTARGTLMRLTVDPATDTAPVWAPDNRRVAFRSERAGGGIFIAPADGSGPVERLTSSDGPGRPAQTPYAFTPDGRQLVFAELRSYTDQGLGVVTLDDPPVAATLLDGPFAEARPALSPDGRWLAYQSDESGRFEIYLRPYPSVEQQRIQVSRQGGSSARWSRDGRELFYFDGTSMVSVPIAPLGDDPGLGSPVVLFDASRYNQRLGPVYDVTAPPERFLLIRDGPPGGTPQSRRELRLVQQWIREVVRILDGAS